jgi:ABC-type transporter Mla MlaB component
MAARSDNCVTIRGPLRRADLPGLYARVCAALGRQGAGVLVCEVSGVASDAVAVEALCRLQLGARHHRCTVRLRGASPELLDLIAYLGLGDVVTRENGRAS